MLTVCWCITDASWYAGLCCVFHAVLASGQTHSSKGYEYFSHVSVATWLERPSISGDYVEITNTASSSEMAFPEVNQITAAQPTVNINTTVTSTTTVASSPSARIGLGRV